MFGKAVQVPRAPFYWCRAVSPSGDGAFSRSTGGNGKGVAFIVERAFELRKNGSVVATVAGTQFGTYGPGVTKSGPPEEGRTAWWGLQLFVLSVEQGSGGADGHKVGHRLGQKNGHDLVGKQVGQQIDERNEEQNLSQ